MRNRVALRIDCWLESTKKPRTLIRRNNFTVEKRQEMVLSVTGLMRFFAKRRAYGNTGTGEWQQNFDDLLSRFQVAVCEATITFDPTLGKAFSTHAGWAMRAASREHNIDRLQLRGYIKSPIGCPNVQSINDIETEIFGVLNSYETFELTDAINKLPSLEKQVVVGRMSEMTYLELGKEIKRTARRARQLFDKAIDRLAELLPE